MLLLQHFSDPQAPSIQRESVSSGRHVDSDLIPCWRSKTWFPCWRLKWM